MSCGEGLFFNSLISDCRNVFPAINVNVCLFIEQGNYCLPLNIWDFPYCCRTKLIRSIVMIRTVIYNCGVMLQNHTHNLTRDKVKCLPEYC